MPKKGTKSKKKEVDDLPNQQENKLPEYLELQRTRVVCNDDAPIHVHTFICHSSLMAFHLLIMITFITLALHMFPCEIVCLVCLIYCLAYKLNFTYMHRYFYIMRLIDYITEYSKCFYFFTINFVCYFSSDKGLNMLLFTWSFFRYLVKCTVEFAAIHTNSLKITILVLADF